MAFLSRVVSSALPVRLARLYGRSLFAALLVMVFGGLAIPAGVGGYLLIGVQEREVARRELDDRRSQQALRAKQWRYALVLAVQLIVSLLLILLLLRRRLLAPPGTLMSFSDRLSRGKFDTPLALSTNDELGRLGRQLERMRIAIGDLFQDIGRREERFRTIVTQVPGAVFRARPGGTIDFVSDAIEDISGYPATTFIGAHTDRRADVICPEDRRMQRHLVRDAVLADTGLAPQRLQLEVTESVIMNTGDALEYINDLHALGVKLAIDDFGTGYSSLAYLKQLPVETLKIDRSFIKDIPVDKDDEAIAVAIVQLGKSMGLAVIAEGVETVEQAAFLLRHGCRRAQGYLYGRPVGADDILDTWREEDAGHDRTRFG